MADTRCVERVELNLSASGLPKLDTFSNTDAFAVVFLRNSDRTTRMLGHTEVIMDSNSPSWSTSVQVDYCFEEVQDIVVKVYDKDDGPLTDLNRHDFCGEISFKLCTLMCAPGQTTTQALQTGRGVGRVTVKGEVMTGTRDEFQCSFAGSKLVNKDGFFGKSDPFLVISRMREDNTYVRVFTNQPVMNNLSPTWPVLRIPMQKLCNGDLDRPIKVEIYDWDADGSHDSMGEVHTSVNALLSSRGQPMNVIEQDKKSKKGYVNSGTLSCMNPSVISKPTLLDYIKGGCEISLSVAIDFTGSNGNPTHPNSLHFMDPAHMRLNQYESAILAVGSVVESYDSDRMFPVYGFGAQVMGPTGQFSPVQHCFPVYGGGFEVQGVNGILQAYRDCLPRVNLSGPTIFTPLLTQTLQKIQNRGGCTQSNQKYDVLLILTDGIINDMEQTIDTIVTLSNHPISIIIIGVGNADFSDMSALDGDEGGLVNSRRIRAARDIVQFVKFNSYASTGHAALAKDVLAEVPDQLLSFMEKFRITPNPPTPPPVYVDPAQSTGPPPPSYDPNAPPAYNA